MASDVEARKLLGAQVGLPRLELPPAPEGSFYIADLIGLKAEDESGRALGLLSAVFPSGGHDLYEIQPLAGSAFLVPAVKEFIKKIDLEQRRLVIHLMPGLRPEDEA